MNGRFAMSLVLCACAAAAGLSRPARSQVAVTYAVTNLGVTTGTDTSRGTAVNRNGHVAGFTERSGYIYHAFRWSNGVMTDLGTLGYTGTGSGSIANGINEAGVIVGDAATKSGAGRVFIHDGSKMIDITRKNGGRGFAINNLTQVVGDINAHPYLWSSGTLTYLPGLSSASGQATPRAINDAGLIAGTAQASDASSRGVLWQGGQIAELPGVPGQGASLTGYGLNNTGVVVGSTRIAGSSLAQPAVWRGGAAELLPRLPLAVAGAALDVNDAGQIVGTTAGRACLWDGAGVHDLNDLKDPVTGQGWVLQSAASISEDGKIAGFGLFNGVRRAFLLTPQ